MYENLTDTIDPSDMTDFTRTENALVSALGLISATHTGALIRGCGYPPPSPEQGQEMARLEVRAWAAFVRGLRAPGAGVPVSSDYIEIAQGISQGAILAVLGQPPDVVAEQLANAN